MGHKRTVVRTIMQGDETEIQWGVGDSDEAISGYIVVQPDGTARFPHGEGFAFIMAGDDTRVEAEDGTILWHVNSIAG